MGRRSSFGSLDEIVVIARSRQEAIRRARSDRTRARLWERLVESLGTGPINVYCWCQCGVKDKIVGGGCCDLFKVCKKLQQWRFVRD